MLSPVLKTHVWVARGGWITAATAAGIGENVIDEATGVPRYVVATVGRVHENRRGVLIEVRSGPSVASSLDAVGKAASVLASHMNVDGLTLERYGEGQI